MKHILAILLLAFLSFNCERNAPDPVPLLPTVTTAPATSVTANAALSGGNATISSGPSISARGVCWGIAPNPLITGNYTVDGSGPGTFASPITGLTANTRYYVRAYATNIVGTSYGNEISFTTTNSTTALPTVTTTAITAILMTTAKGGGNVTADGGAPITARGVCWSVAANPTIALPTKTTDGTGAGIFTSAITGLSAATTYHVRAYATNSVGTSYGGDSTFTTASTSTIPTITTTAITAITNTKANSGGTISTDGGAAVTTRGVCWSTTPNPTIALLTKTTDGTGIGTFTSAITGLTASTTYHVRAYATNIVGTAYGNDVSFTTTGSSTPDVYVAGVLSHPITTNTVATVWKNGVATSLTNGVNDAEAHKVFVSGIDVYVSGWEMVGSSREGRIWKNGALYNFGGCGSGVAYAGPLYVSGTDVYVAGVCSGATPNQITIWKNGVVNSVINGTSLRLSDIFVSGTDIYVSGEENTDQKFWKNGVATTIAANTTIPYGWDNALFVSGTDVYVSFNSNDPNNIPKMWKNGVVTNLNLASPNLSLVFDVYVSGTDVYAAGADPAAGGSGNSTAVIWKNGVRIPLSNGINIAYAESVFVFGTDVYVAGVDGFSEPMLWKNGVRVALGGAPNPGYAFGVFVK